MKAIVVGCGRTGSAIALQLSTEGWDVTVVDEQEEALARLGSRWQGGFVLGHALDDVVLRRAGIEGADAVAVATDGDNTNTVVGQAAQLPYGAGTARPPDQVLAVTGDDEDNLVICQIAKEGYGVPKAIARVNDPRNQQHFDLLGITQTVCATTGILGLGEP